VAGFTPVPSGPAASGAVEAVGSGAIRPSATTRSRHRARGANTPWQMSRLVSGRGVIAAKRSKPSSGSNTSSRVPSCQAVFSTAIMNAHQVDRGYERIDERLRSLGARITREPGA